MRLKLICNDYINSYLPIVLIFDKLFEVRTIFFINKKGDKIVQFSKKSTISRKKKKLTKDSMVDYRAWPIFMLAFVRLFYVSIFERALQNYLYFIIDINESTLGFISSAGAIAYIFAPIIGQVITSKLGIRNSIILSSIITPILTGVQMIYFEPWFLILVRISLGLTMGVFWPNCFNLLSKWQRISTIEKSKKNFKHFNFSWNFGFILGLLTGYILAFSWNDYLTMIISWSLSFLLIPFSFFINREPPINDIKDEPIVQIEKSISQASVQKSVATNSNTPMIAFPILFSWVGLLFLTITKSSFIFSYQVFLKTFGQPSTYTYLVSFGIQLTQVLGLTWINSMNVYKRKLAALVSIFFIMFFALQVIIAPNIWYISIFSAAIGLFLGLIHGTSMKIMLEYGIAKNTTIYSTINEIIIGIGFGLTPIIAGYVTEINIYPIFVFVMLFGAVLLIIQIYLSRNVKRTHNTHS